MVASKLAEKRKATYDLDAIKAAIGSVETLAITTSALRDAIGLGFDRAGIVDVIMGINRKMFVKSMTTFADHRVCRMSTTCRPAIWCST